MSIDFEAIRARAEAATPGPWTYVDNGFDGYIMSASEDRIVGGEPAEGRIEPDDPNADFIAHSRQDIPALLTEVKRLNIALQDERKEHAEEYGRLRSTYIRESKKLEKQLAYVTAERDDYRQKWYTSNKCYNAICAERDALKEDFMDFACSGFTNAAPYCANKSSECTDAHEWCINEKCKGFYPNACGAGKEQNDG